VAKGESFTRRKAAIGASIGLAVLCACWLVWWKKPPQMGADKEVFATVDALFTALTARDEKLLGQCEQRLDALKSAGKLPQDASDYLDGNIKMAREGRWEATAERLYSFMKVQARAGAEGQRARKAGRGRSGQE
jgi:hypothetical protein